MTKPYKNLVAKIGKCTSKNHTSKTSKIGVLIVNLGTPEKATFWGIRKYLSEFLSDPRVIHTNPLIWQPILQVIILTLRPSRVAKAYKSIWNTELDESPLLTTTRSQAEKLNISLQSKTDNIVVDFAMRYGNPSINDKVKKLMEKGCEHILILPLYPQYSATTTATVNDKVFASLKTITKQPAVRITPPYYKKTSYINELNNSLNKTLQKIDFKAEKIIASYHGIPKIYCEKGDPYDMHCRKTSQLLSKKSGLEITTTFQSIFGRLEWVKPYTEVTLVEMAKSGVKSIVMLAPAFATDCLETLEEIQYEIKDAFLKAGGENFAYVPCLNDSDGAIDMYTEICIDELNGWIKQV